HSFLPNAVRVRATRHCGAGHKSQADPGGFVRLEGNGTRRIRALCRLQSRWTVPLHPHKPYSLIGLLVFSLRSILPLLSGTNVLCRAEKTLRRRNGAPTVAQ